MEYIPVQIIYPMSCVATDKIQVYCNRVVEFYAGSPYVQLLQYMASEPMFINIREALRTACKDWLRPEHIFPFFFSAPKYVAWEGNDSLCRLAAAAMLLLHHGMIVPMPFRVAPTPYRPVPGDDVFCADLCLYLQRIWDAAFRQHTNTKEHMSYARLPSDYREPVKFGAKESQKIPVLETDKDTYKYVAFFEYRVCGFVSENIIRCEFSEEE